MNDFLGNEKISKEHLIFAKHIFNSIQPNVFFDEFYNIFSVEGIIWDNICWCLDATERERVYLKIRNLIESNVGKDYGFLKSEIIVYKSELRKIKN